jgi:hypothetical protein
VIPCILNEIFAKLTRFFHEASVCSLLKNNDYGRSVVKGWHYRQISGVVDMIHYGPVLTVLEPILGIVHKGNDEARKITKI